MHTHSYQISSILYDYEMYKEHSVFGRIVKHEQVINFLRKLEKNPLLEIKKIGFSYEGREIHLIKIGTGKTKILMWSQMHGDESTSTRAAFDLINYIITDDENNRIRKEILDSVTIYIIPMLNPDGAEKFTRRNAQLIDINRDALSLQSQEAEILYRIKNEIKPDFAFNLHDQSSGYSAGINYKSSTISLLAPPFNYQVEVNETRSRAMKLIVSIYNELTELIPGHIARYDDEYESRAFGDNFTNDGVSTILIEAGGWVDDPEREYVRKIYFTVLLKSFLSISDNSYEKEILEKYYEIPENKEILFDLVLRNITVEKLGKQFTVDIAIKHETYFDTEQNKIYTKGLIADIGDLSTFFGYEEFDMFGNILMLPKSSARIGLTIKEYQNKGILFVKNKIKNINWTTEPINYYNLLKPSINLEIESPANFFLLSCGKTRYVIVNGYLIDCQKHSKFIGNGIVYP